MYQIKSKISCTYICGQLTEYSDSADLRLVVAGARRGGPPTPAHKLVLSVLGRQVKDMLAGSEADLIIFPEGSEWELDTLVNYLYRGVKGYISDSLAKALGLFNAVKKFENEEGEEEEDEEEEEEEEEEEIEEKAVCRTFEDSVDEFMSSNQKIEDLLAAEVKMEVEDHEEFGCEVPATKKKRKRRRKDDEDDEDYVVDGKAGRRKAERKVKKETVEKAEDEDEDELDETGKFVERERVKGVQNGKKAIERMTELLANEPHRFRLFNRLYYSGSGRKRRPTETDDKYFKRMMLYEKYPGIIFDDECTRFVVCVECALVTKNIKASHRCEPKVEFLRCKPVEQIKRMHFSNHLTKYFKQKAEKVECRVCLSVLPSMDEFKVHLKELHNIEPLLYKCNSMFGDFVCEDCGKRFTTMNLMRQHEITKHRKLELAKFNCDRCDLYFVTRTYLDTHVQHKHENYRPHVCDECARSFKVKRHLESHKRTHTGEKNIQCRHCDKMFAKEWTRTQHERLHLGLKPYKCDVCDQKFSQKTSLDCHTKTHHSKHKD